VIRHLLILSGFAGLTPLQEAVLIGSSDDVKNQLLMSSAQVDENLLYQSALHLAVWRPHHIDLLLNGKLNVDSRDWNGRTPLMYAAAAGMTKVAISLVKAGADLWVKDRLYGSHDFIRYAVRSTHWDLAIAVLDFVRQSQTFPPAKVQSLLNTATILWAGEISKKRKSEHFHALLRWGADPEILFTDRWKWRKEHSNTLLHCISTMADFDALVGSGFKSFNHENSSGANPLMKLAEWNDPQLLRKCIESGGLVNHRDCSGWTALHVNAESLWESFFNYSSQSWDFRFGVFECVEELLVHGSDPFLGDKCCCACSTSGCTPINILLKEYHELWERFPCLPRCQYFLGLEWLDLIRKINGLEYAKQCLLDIIRLVRFEELELTHTCCRRKLSTEWKGLWTMFDEDEVDEILDEEKEDVAKLESQMCDIEKHMHSKHSGSELEAMFFLEVTKLIQIRNMRQRALFLKSQHYSNTNVSPPCERWKGYNVLTYPFTAERFEGSRIWYLNTRSNKR
jgi:ankyrin repeat protein